VSWVVTVIAEEVAYTAAVVVAGCGAEALNVKVLAMDSLA
jgi:hypothetical protein